MTHFVFWRKFRVVIPPPPPPIAMLKADENVIDELKSMSSSSNQHCNGERGALAVKGNSCQKRKASFTAKLICPKEFCFVLSQSCKYTGISRKILLNKFAINCHIVEISGETIPFGLGKYLSYWDQRTLEKLSVIISYSKKNPFFVDRS